MKKIKRLSISQKPITSKQKKEIIEGGRQMSIPGVVYIEDHFVEWPGFLDGVVLESDNDIDESWLQKKAANLSYNWVHLIMDDEEWKEAGIRSTLYGQAGVAKGQVITYGRWAFGKPYRYAAKYTNDLKDLALKFGHAFGMSHEGDHGFRGLFRILMRLVRDSSGPTHTYWYGYDRLYTSAEEEKLKPERWQKTPEPLVSWRSLNWGLLPSAETHEPDPTYDYGLKITKRHPKPIERYSWTGNVQDSIVFHTLLGTIEGSLSWTEQIHLSYNFMIAKDGSVVEQIPIERSAWHAGVVSGETQRVKDFFKGVNPNKRSVGIAFEAKGEPNITKEQVASAVAVIKIVGQKTGRTYGPDNMFAHREITSYKPVEVLKYKEQVITALGGEKEEKPEIPENPIENEQRARISELLKIIAGLLAKLGKQI